MDMNKRTIIHELDKLVLENPEVDEVNELNDQTDLINDYAFDSLSIIQLVTKVEEKFGISIEDDSLNLDFLRKYDWWKNYLISKIGEKNG